MKTTYTHPCDGERISPSPPAENSSRDDISTHATQNMDGLTFAQRLYASALPVHRQPKQIHSQNDNVSETGPPANTRRSSRSSVSQPAIQTNTPNPAAYDSTESSVSSPRSQREWRSSGSSESIQSFYASGIASQAQPHRTQLPGSRFNSGVPDRVHSSHIVPQRTQSYNTTKPTSPEPHRASTYSAGAAAAFTKPYEFTPPKEVPNRVLVARPPPVSSQEYGNVSSPSNITSSPSYGISSPQSPSLPPKHSPIQHISVQPQTNVGATLPSQSTPVQQQYHPQPGVMQTASPPTSTNTYTSPSLNTTSASSVRPPSLTLPTFQRPSSLFPSAGASALRFVGGAVLGGVLGFAPGILSGLAGSILPSDMLSTLTASLANFNASDVGLDPEQLQSAFQGLPGTDYQSIYNAILQQQQVAPNSKVDYQLLINALKRIQAASSAGIGTSPMFGSTPANNFGSHGNANAYQAIANAQSQQVQGVMNAIQQQSALNTQLVQQQIQQIQNASLAQANAQTQNLLQGMQQQQQQQHAQPVANHPVSPGSSHIRPPQSTSQSLHSQSPSTSPQYYAQSPPTSPHYHTQSPPTSPPHNAQQFPPPNSPNQNVHVQNGVNIQLHQSQRPTAFGQHQTHQFPQSTPNHHVQVHGPNAQLQQPPYQTTQQYQQPLRPPLQQQQPPRPPLQQLQQPPRPPLQQQQQTSSLQQPQQQQSYDQGSFYQQNAQHQQQSYDQSSFQPPSAEQQPQPYGDTAQDYSYQYASTPSAYQDAPYQTPEYQIPSVSEDAAPTGDEAPPPFTDTINALGQALTGIMSLGGSNDETSAAGDVPQYTLSDEGGGVDSFANGILTAGFDLNVSMNVSTEVST
uniref:Uncharacterized protein n=1 Tax=Moniliophthora roreri TaxID=221103 RepID=A0A0W0GDY6_MONRR